MEIDFEYSRVYSQRVKYRNEFKGCFELGYDENEFVGENKFIYFAETLAGEEEDEIQVRIIQGADIETFPVVYKEGFYWDTTKDAWWMNMQFQQSR